MPPLLLDGGAHQPRLVAMHIMLAQDFAHRVDARLNGGLVVGCAILAEQVLQHVGGHDGVALHHLDKVLANHQPSEVLIDLVVQLAHVCPLAIFLEIELAGERAANRVPRGLVARVVGCAVHRLVHAQLHLLVVVVVGLATEDEAHRDLPFTRVAGRHVEAQLLHVRNRLACQRVQADTQAARMAFVGDGFGLVQHHSQLPRRDGLAAAANQLHLHLAHIALALLVDADDQQSAVKWSKRRTENLIDTEHHKGDLKKVLLDLQKKYKYVVLDVAGRDSEEFRSALQVADKLIVPTQPSQADVEVLPFVLKMFNTFQKVNEKLEPFIVVNKAPSNTKSTEVADSIELLQTLPKFKILNTVIRDRKQFRDASVQGLSVLEMGSSKAKDEFNEFLVEIL